MYLFIFIANSWGPMNGGINSFNYDLSRACASEVGNDGDTKICCVVPELSKNEIDEIKSIGIIPITLSNNAFMAKKEAVKIIFDKIESNIDLMHYFPRYCDVFCVGHDVYSGEISYELAKKCNGKNVVFHHMDYTSYYLYQNGNVNRYIQKEEIQKKILKSADLVFAVGPKLFLSAKDIVRNKRTKVIKIIPGLSDFEPIEGIKIRFNPIVFGRVEENNVRIKQTALAVDAFAKAISMDKELKVIGDDATLLVVGYNNVDDDFFKQEVERLQKNAAAIAGKLCNIVPRLYITDRGELGNLICDASVAMMLSYHEGFGLVGLEAIAAGIPLIISENTGLYQFLVDEKLEDMVYHVAINGSTDEKGYSKEDLVTVSKALRTIRNKENVYKNNALLLRNKLIKNSWNFVARDFMKQVLENLSYEVNNNDTFFRPEQLSKLNDVINEDSYTDLSLEEANRERIYKVKGRNALVSLYKLLKRDFKNYAIRIYCVNSEVKDSNSYYEFFNDCVSFFGKSKDSKGPEFRYVLGERLENTILILDNLDTELNSDFNELFNEMYKSNYDFYLFAVSENDSPISITSYDLLENDTSKDFQNIKNKPIPKEMADELIILYKALCFRNKKEYNKNLVKYVCKGINRYCELTDGFPAFLDASETEGELINYGLIEEYSKLCYQNCGAYIKSFNEYETNDGAFFYAIFYIGKFYAKIYKNSQNRVPKLEHAYFSCRCFDYASSINNELREKIKGDYERIIHNMRKNVMDTSDYGRYIKVIQKFIDRYCTPDNPWIWYMLYHCESLYAPSADTLEKVKKVLNEEIPKLENSIKKEELLIQMARLCSELENELEIEGPLDHLIERTENISDKTKESTTWNQCLSTLVSIAISQNDYKKAEHFLEEYKRKGTKDNLYPKVIAVALDTELLISKEKDDRETAIQKILPQIKNAYFTSKYNIRDYRSQGWTLGLWGECQVLLGDIRSGESNIRKSMEHRRISGEKTKSYRDWLKRISKYKLQDITHQFLTEEIARTSTEIA